MRIPALIAVAAVAATTLTACASTASPEASPDDLDAASCSVEDGDLRVYLNPFGSTLSDKFTDDTGIGTEIADLGGGEILARIAAEANNPQWDVVLLDGHGSLEALADDDQLLTGHQLTNLEQLTAEGQALLRDDHAWVPFSQHAAAVIAYNTDRVGETDAPRTWADLTRPKYAPIGIADPAVAAPAYPVVSWFFQDLGTDSAEDYFDTLFANGLHTYEKNGPVGEALISGETTVAALQEQNVYSMIEAGEPVDFVWPDEGAPGVVRAVAISADTPRPCAALTLVDWLLEADTVEYLMEHGEDDGIFTPLVEGVDTSSLPDDRPADAPLLLTDASFAAEHEAAIKDWFADQQAR
ncbi:extracellular solute-binding protein [Aeromicrobium phragmitis]|uniref:Extracellular solute-binding protein n=1 Tax=Aeromicrobium phragmitis TaxID=2478914 RepID=A0A3L8PHH3_9ACTN|nr:extracellular solute-binding protein [Aeromicrobium phragmitis]RLV54675.1 extracellular solute-binding protein [Aeromicrobium phragmitis]